MEQIVQSTYVRTTSRQYLKATYKIVCTLLSYITYTQTIVFNYPKRTTALQLQQTIFLNFTGLFFFNNGQMLSTTNVNGQMSQCKELLKCGGKGLQPIYDQKELRKLQQQTKQLTLG